MENFTGQQIDALINGPIAGHAGQLAQGHVPKLACRIPTLLALFIFKQDFLFGMIDLHNAANNIEWPDAVIATDVANAKF